MSAHTDRFSDWDSMCDFCVFGKDRPSLSQTFYNGETLTTRMATLRKAIHYVRNHWDDYSTLMKDLRSYIQELTIRGDNRDLLHHLSPVFASTKVWNHHDAILDDDSSAIRLYTSREGYDQIFRIMNQEFRTSNVAEQEMRVRCATFLIELLNIDLFNYTLRTPSANDFQGTVYRGVVFSDEQLQDFRSLAAQPVSERYWGIPLAMMSASTNREVALKGFAGLNHLTEGTDATARHPFLWRIHVTSLFPKYMKMYRERFPSSVVSTICAVPIWELSQYAEEDEVLLRGPFFQLICLQEEVFDGYEKPICVMDLVLLNANRDHPSTLRLGPEAGKARHTFSCLIGMCLAEVSKELSNLYGLVDDVVQFHEMYQAWQAKLANFDD